MQCCVAVAEHTRITESAYTSESPLFLAISVCWKENQSKLYSHTHNLCLSFYSPPTRHTHTLLYMHKSSSPFVHPAPKAGYRLYASSTPMSSGSYLTEVQFTKLEQESCWRRCSYRPGDTRTSITSSRVVVVFTIRLEQTSKRTASFGKVCTKFTEVFVTRDEGCSKKCDEDNEDDKVQDGKTDDSSLP